MGNKIVALLLGGWSAERQVSLIKGKKVEEALLQAGYDVRVIDVQKDIIALQEALTPKPDVVFNNLHGKGGEDGTIQAVLEMLEIPYTHSGVSASAIGMDKPASKKIANSLGVPVAEEKIVSFEEILAGDVLDPPYVVKPPCEGSSVGVKIVKNAGETKKWNDIEWPFGAQLMAERYIPGRELTVAVLDGKPQAVSEIVSETEFFDYEAKYHDSRTKTILPADIPEEIYNMALDYAARVYNGIGCSGLARCDFRYDDTGTSPEKLYFLEINTQPGLTAESIGPSQVIYNGMSFVQLCSHMVETAQCHGQEKQNQPAGKKDPVGTKQRA